MKKLLMALAIMVLFTACNEYAVKSEEFGRFKTEQDLLADKRIWIKSEYKEFKLYNSTSKSFVTQGDDIIYKGNRLYQEDFLTLVSGINMQDNSEEGGGTGIGFAMPMDGSGGMKPAIVLQ